jgi:hypothetical protein
MENEKQKPELSEFVARLTQIAERATERFPHEEVFSRSSRPQFDSRVGTQGRTRSLVSYAAWHLMLRP